MKAEKHLSKSIEIKKSIEKLLPDEKGEHVVAIVELTYGLLQHLIAYGMEKKYGRHIDSHVGLCKELRNLNEDEIAEIFESLDTFRAGRWYGGKGNGNLVKKCIEYIKTVEEWTQ